MVQVFGSCKITFSSASAHNSKLQPDPGTWFSLQLCFLTHIFWFADTEKRGRLSFEPGCTLLPEMNVELVAHRLSEEFPQWVPAKKMKQEELKYRTSPPFSPSFHLSMPRPTQRASRLQGQLVWHRIPPHHSQRRCSGFRKSHLTTSLHRHGNDRVPAAQEQQSFLKHSHKIVKIKQN